MKPMNRARVLQEVPVALVGAAILYAQRLARHYASGGSPRSRERSGIRETEKNAMRLAQGKIGEVALALYFGFDPYRVLNWQMTADDGCDLVGPLAHRIDVKTTFPHYKVIWSNTVNDLFFDKRFDTLVGVSIAEFDFSKTWLEGWIPKTEFYDRKKIANGNGLEAGTWYLDKADLRPIEILRNGLTENGRAALAIRQHMTAEYVMGRWP